MGARLGSPKMGSFEKRISKIWKTWILLLIPHLIFLEQETEKFKPLEIKILKTSQTIDKGSKQNGCETLPISCASLLMSFLDQVSDGLLSSANTHCLKIGTSDLEKF